MVKASEKSKPLKQWFPEVVRITQMNQSLFIELFGWNQSLLQQKIVVVTSSEEYPVIRGKFWVRHE